MATETNTSAPKEAPLSPQEGKRRERAERIAYILNHSIYCTFTDFFKPVINTFTDGYLSWLFPGCGHDHSGDDKHEHHHDDHHHHHHEHKHDNRSRWARGKDAARHSFSKERLKTYVKGEFLGDFGAIPLSIWMQDLFPKLIPAIRSISEPVMGPVFRMGAKRSANKWAKANGVEIGSQAYHAKANALYAYEMHHFPQAVLWTANAFALNTAYQMWADKSHVAFPKKLALKSSTVLSGMLITSGVVVGTRAMLPEKMHNLDQSNVQKAILPATKWVGKLFGVREEDMNRMLEKEQSGHGHEVKTWGERIANKPQNNKGFDLAA